MRVLATDFSGVVTNLTATLSQVSINVELHSDVFLAPIRDDYESMTLEQFSGTSGPLEAPFEDAALP